MPAGLRARRFAEKQYTRRLVGLGNSWEASCAPNGGRCVRSDSLGIWRDSEGRGWRGGEVTPSSLCVCNAVTHVTLGRVPRAPIDMDTAPNRFPPAGRVLSATCRP